MFLRKGSVKKTLISPSRKPNKGTNPLSLESLEKRELFAADMTTVFDTNTGVASAQGVPANGPVEVRFLEVPSQVVDGATRSNSSVPTDSDGQSIKPLLMTRQSQNMTPATISSPLVGPLNTNANGITSTNVAAIRMSGFGDTQYQPITGRVVGQVQVDGVNLTSANVNISGVLSSAWTSAKGQAEKMIVQKINGMKAGPVSVYNADVHFGSVRMEAKSVGSGILVRMTSTDNYLRFKTTTPKLPVLGFGLGSWADPRIHVDFSVSIEVLLTVDSNNNLRATVQSGQISDLRTRGANVTGWLANAVTDVYQFMGGTNVRNSIQDLANNQIKSRIENGKVSFAQRLLPSIPKVAQSSGLFYDVKNGDIVVTLWFSTKKYQPPMIK